MECKKCGKEVDKKQKYCPYCGNKLKGNKLKKVIGVIIIVFIALIGFGTVISSSENKKTIKKLEAITEIEKDGDIYDFNYNRNQWKIRCTKENIHARLYEPDVKDMLDTYVGYDSGNEYEFTYDFKNNKITIYSDIDMKHDGDEFSIIDYDIDKDEFEIMKNSEDRYELSDEFEQYIRDSGIIETMKHDIETMKKILKENDLTIDEITSLDFNNVKKYVDE